MTTTEFDPDSLRAKYEFERDKRLRAEGNDQYTDISDFEQYLEDPYVQPLNREPLFDEVEVAVIGGGFGGLLAGARLREGRHRPGQDGRCHQGEGHQRGRKRPHQAQPQGPDAPAGSSRQDRLSPSWTAIRTTQYHPPGAP